MKPMWAGYYYAAGKYGDFTPAQNCTVLGLSMFADGDGTLQPGAKARQRSAAERAGAIFIGSSDADIENFRGAWHLVAGVWLKEFADLDAATEEAAWAKQRMDRRGWPARPVIFTVMPDQVFQPGWRVPKHVDWLAVEIYFDTPEVTSIDQRLAVQRRVEQVTRQLPAGLPVILIAQSYDRNGNPAWQLATEQLAAIQHATAEQAQAFSFIQGVWWFAYARPGGAKDYPRVELACAAIAATATRPAIVNLTDPHRLTISSYDWGGTAPFTCRAVARIEAGTFDRLIWRWRKLDDPTWQIAAVNPSTDLDHHFRFTLPGAYAISLRGEYADGAAETGALRIVNVDPQPTTGPGTTPEGSKMKIVDLPTYDEFVGGADGRVVEDAVRSSTHRPITAAEVRHNAWRRLRENWTLDNIVRAIHRQEPVDLDMHTPDWPGTPTYDELLTVEGPQVDAAFRQKHGVKPGPADVRHNTWRRLVEGWTQDNLLKDIKGEPNDGPTLTKPTAASTGGGPVKTGDGPRLGRRSGLVLPFGSSGITDAEGPFLGLGASLFWALWAFVHDRERLERNLAVLSGRVHYIRVFAVVGPGGGWADRTVDPRDRGWADAAAGLTDLAFDTYGIRIEWTVFAGIDNCPSQTERIDAVGRLIAALQGRFEKVMHFEVANEAGINGFDGVTGADNLRELAAILKDRTPNLVAVSAPGSEEQGQAWYEHSQADLATIHPDRSQSGTGGMWRPVRQPWDVHFQPGLPSLRSLNEPIGPRSSVAMDDDPLRLVMLAATGYVTGSAMFVLHTGAGVRGGGAADLGTGKFYLPRPANIWEVEHIDAILDGLVLVAMGLPPDVPNWSKQNGNSKFPDYPFHVEHLTEDVILRAYCAVGGSRFVAVPMQIMKPVQLQARRKMTLRAFDPLSGDLLQKADLEAGQTLTLNTTPPACILFGEYE